MSTWLTIFVTNNYPVGNNSPTLNVSSAGNYFKDDDVTPTQTKNFPIHYSGASPFTDTVTLARKNGTNFDDDCKACKRYNVASTSYGLKNVSKVDIPISMSFVSGADSVQDETTTTVTVGANQPC